MPTLSDATDLFERRRRAWLAEDIEGYLALWSPDMSFQSPAHAEPIVGRDRYEELIRMSQSLVRPVGFEILHLAVNGPLALAEWRGEIEWRADGRRSVWHGMSVCEISDGQITVWREYWNPADFGLPELPTE